MQEQLKVRIKLTHPNAKVPQYSKPGDAGMDLTAVTITADANSRLTYDTGIAIEIPDGYVGLVFPRSSNCKKDLYLTNSVGVIDSCYRGSIKMVYAPDFEHWQLAFDQDDFHERLNTGELLHHNTAEDKFFSRSNIANCYAIGDRIGQLIIMPYPKIDFEIVDELSETERGEGGYGSTGR